MLRIIVQVNLLISDILSVELEFHANYSSIIKYN